MESLQQLIYIIYSGSNGYRKERSLTVLGKILQKSPRAISRELEQRMVELILEEHYSPYAVLERLGKEGKPGRRG